MAEKSPVRVRFAPSPTGHLHVGNARTALFNWLFARQKGGQMILRIEDTDVERSQARYESLLMDDLKWLGLDWDEGPDVGGSFGPYRQSDRLSIYREHAERLLNEGKAYLCFCTEEELQKERDAALAEQRQAIYSGKCRRLDPQEAQKRRANGEAGAIRLKIPEHPIRFHDIVRGDVEFSNEVVSDPVIVRSSGMPVYNYVVVIDDALMKITHVIRGDDHLSNTPKQVALYEALGWPVPEFAHLSTILGSDRERLSKRHGATSIANFREMGVLPEALMNYLALLGWAPSGGNREIFKAEELIKEFSLKRVTPSPAVFDMEKLYWLNRQYIKEQGTVISEDAIKNWIRIVHTYDPRSPELTKALTNLPKEVQLASVTWDYFEKAEYLPNKNAATIELMRWLSEVGSLFRPYIDRLDQLPRISSSIFNYDAERAILAIDNAEALAWPQTNAVLHSFRMKILSNEDARAGSLSPETFNKIVNDVKTETGAKGKELFHPIRIVVMGSHSGPAFDKLVPVLEEGSHLPLPKRVLSVKERVESFSKAFENNRSLA